MYYVIELGYETIQTAMKFISWIGMKDKNHNQNFIIIIVIIIIIIIPAMVLYLKMQSIEDKKQNARG